MTQAHTLVPLSHVGTSTQQDSDLGLIALELGVNGNPADVTVLNM